MQNTREDLNTLTAKALRPIAADLGITGASRMKKDELIRAIEHAESLKATAEVVAEQAENQWATDLVRERTDAIVNPAPGTGFVKEDGVTSTTCAEIWADGMHAKLEARGLVPPKVVDSLFDADTIEDVKPVHGPTRADFLMSLDWDDATVRRIDAAYAEALEIHTERETDIKRDREIAEDLGLLTFPRAQRMTRHGIETVVVEDVRGGKVHYRHVEKGRLSAPYSMRENNFTERFTPVTA